MDPIGFSLEHYDGIGAWREKDGKFTIDSSGRLKTGETFEDAISLLNVLASAKRAEFARSLTEKTLTYALGRGLEYYDRCAVESITSDLAKQDYRFSTLILGVVKSVPFQNRRGEGERKMRYSANSGSSAMVHCSASLPRPLGVTLASATLCG